MRERETLNEVKQRAKEKTQEGRRDRKTSNRSGSGIVFKSIGWKDNVSLHSLLSGEELERVVQTGDG